MRLRSKLIISYIVLITLPLAILGTGFYFTSQQTTEKLARDNVLEIVKKNNQLIDERLIKLQNDSLSLMTECDLFQLFNGAPSKDGLQQLQTDRKVKEILNRYFSQSGYLYSVQLATRDYLYGDKGKNTFPPKQFYETDMYTGARMEKGSIAWIPTYDYSSMYKLSELDDVDLEYRHLFSAVREISPSCVRDTIIVRAESGSERPYLIMNFQESLYADVFNNSIPIHGASYLVANSDGAIIASQKEDSLARAEWIQPLWTKGSGTAMLTIDGEKMLACFATSAVTGWMSVVLIPPKELVVGLTRTINVFTLTLGVSLLLMSLLFAYWISSRISLPVNKLLLAIKRVGTGDFTARIEVPSPSKDEFGHVLTKFNSMNERIEQLIDENFVVKLREKETEIMALNIQLNPHFLYNTLNIMNWMAVNGDKEQVSSMLISLSRMLHYTTDNTRDSSKLEDDLNWLKDYIVIMKSRFDERFEVSFEIDPQLLGASVPKLFLQPLVENSIIHGFRNMESGGFITVYGRKSEEVMQFIVEDNGCGIHTERRVPGEGGSVGLRNVDKRIKLLYGSLYGIEIESEEGLGTRISLEFPYKPHE
ncbi:HAMP domain-containing protein [Paenibacillus sp. 5J-6]|uniref:HAMP domain-containing protein n=1 Tax=Paenibacillus silvestris TaxID=2606219 RepID=A0A6L8V7Q6_9BACL|nr:sensor histidine kinase [Paenibacillus silvestris]MZQ85359.1 HAMP domain-containing protein [Paenibacillus silvestris]